MFGYINKDKLLKKLKEEMELWQKAGEINSHLASKMLELKLAARTENDKSWYDAEYYKFTRLSEQANQKWLEAGTIYNMVKQM